MNSLINLREANDRIIAWGCQDLQNGYLKAELALFDSYIGLEVIPFKTESGDEYLVHMPEQARHKDFPSAFPDMFFRLVEEV